jgi:L-threonylcarbamoyladenylate synthase
MTAEGLASAGGPPEVVLADAAQIARAAALLRAGLVVGFPTETSYGLAADALSAAAVARVAQVKGRGPGHPMPVLVADLEMLRRIALDIPARARALIASHWPGPLTIVLPGVPGLPRSITNDAGAVGVRVSSDPIAQQLVQAAGGPITATSANATGEPPAQDPVAAACAGVVLVLADGPRRAPVSTVVEVRGDAVIVLRQGPVRIQDGPGDHRR